MKSYNYFASANTGIGFCNHFESILDPTRKGFEYVIKGGSGTGKSTMMRKVADHFIEKNFDIEFFYCSSDKSSLDGIRIVKPNICIVDGTAPHVTEASLPMICDKIVNVGEFIGEGVSAHEEKIKELVKTKKQIYNEFYLYIESASKLYENNFLGKIERIDYDVENLLKNFPVKNGKGGRRNLFNKTISEGGVFEIENHFERVFEIDCDIFFAHILFESLSKELQKRNYLVIEFMDLLKPNIISSLFIEEAGVYLVNINNDIKNKKLINYTLKKAGDLLGEAKSVHRQIEKFYIQAMNFDGLTTLTEKLIEDIEKRSASLCEQ